MFEFLKNKRCIIEDGVLKKYIFDKGPFNDAIMLPYSVKKIEKEALSTWTNHLEVIIPESVTDIDEEAFHYVKFVDIYGKPGSYAHQYAKKRKRGLTTFSFYSIYSSSLSTRIYEKVRLLRFLQYFKTHNYEKMPLPLPYELFKVDNTESCDNDGNVDSYSRAVVMIDDGELAIESTIIRYNAHNIAHCSTPFKTHIPISFDDLQYYIELSKDEKAPNYIGMNEHNWEDYLRKYV